MFLSKISNWVEPAFTKSSSIQYRYAWQSSLNMLLIIYCVKSKYKKFISTEQVFVGIVLKH